MNIFYQLISHEYTYILIYFMNESKSFPVYAKRSTVNMKTVKPY